MKKKDIAPCSLKKALEDIQSDFLTGDNSEFRTITITGNNTAGVFNLPYTYTHTGSIPDLNVGDLVKKVPWGLLRKSMVSF